MSLEAAGPYIRVLIALVLLFPLWVITDVVAEKLVSGRWKVFVVSVVCGVVFTGISFAWLQSKSILKEETAVPAQMSRLQAAFFGAEERKKENQSFIDDNFILINTAGNPMLVGGGGESTEDSTLTVITDRNKLVRLLHFLNQLDTSLNLVVCDIVFTERSGYDEDLLKEFDRLQHHNKLVLAYNENLAAKYPGFYKRLDVSSFGDVTKVSDEPLYFSHNLLTEGDIPSLPYSMYLKLRRQTVETCGPFLLEGSRFVSKKFIPEFTYTDENTLYHLPDTAASVMLKIKPDTNLAPSGPRTVYSLGYSVTADGQAEISDLLQMKKGRSLNIVMISSFGERSTDRHVTAFGDLCGTTILLNEFHYIFYRYHSMKLLKVAAYAVVLLISYWAIFYSLFWISLKKERPNEKLIDRLKIALEFLIEEPHFVLLFLLVLVIDGFFDRILNIMTLIYFFVPFSSMLKFSIKHRRRATIKQTP